MGWIDEINPGIDPGRVEDSNAINHPPNHHFYGWSKPSKLVGFIIALPTLGYDWEKKQWGEKWDDRGMVMALYL